ncbi:ATP-binding protein [Fredinandcohnia sp. QZ13]|uniref:ATP-binding protein n=1 Tax=Fredinandcohnia sp. QZ13 TaxID=3073144 RepID=UPI0028532D8D|nr:ATP-binding protein [Fredinandcohnia sp. QZ13]MDR4887542.1 ATP-binding protein [Fredinandcohnia sp. QZ13]
MKSINLISLLNAKKDLSRPVFELYLNNYGINIRDNELHDLYSLVTLIESKTQELGILDEFYVGYTIPQISKEFDLLRFGKDKIINIELKTKNTGNKIKNQLIKNRYYLSFLAKELLNFTYVVEDQELYYLDNDGELIETEITHLISVLNEQSLESIEDINKLFNPSNYLVSPFNSTEAFIEGEYFLTDHQENIKKEILELKSVSGPCFITLEGAAGTGKTLLTYDIAKEFINSSKNVIIFHCGSLNNGHLKLRHNYSWSITSVKHYESYDLKKYDLIILDETQRIYTHQLEDLINNIMETNVKCIFSFDPRQCLASWEIKRNIPQYIKNKVSPKQFRLTEKIRTNQEIGSFIKNLFNLSNVNPNQEYSNIGVQYFSTVNDAREYMDLLKSEGWKIINYTPSRYNRFPYDRYHDSREETAHNVIGQEFDNVIAVLDKYFYYTKEGKLSTRGWPSKPYYHPTQMLFQIVTRTRKKLNIIIINNEPVLYQCLKILGLK